MIRIMTLQQIISFACTGLKALPPTLYSKIITGTGKILGYGISVNIKNKKTLKFRFILFTKCGVLSNKRGTNTEEFNNKEYNHF